MNLTVDVDAGAGQSDRGGGDLPDLTSPHSSHEFSASRRKLDELFFHWLGLEETGALVSVVVSDIKAGKDIGLHIPRATLPLSPVSQLINAVKVISGEEWSPGKHQPSTPPRSPKSRGSPTRGSPRQSPGRDHGGGSSGDTCVLATHALPPASPKSSPARAKRAPDVDIPRFYFPMGQAQMPPDEEARVRGKIDQLFAAGDGHLGPMQMREVAQQVAGVPRFFGCKLFALLGKQHSDDGSAESGDNTGTQPQRPQPQVSVSRADFVTFWEQNLRHASPAARVFAVLNNGTGAKHVVARDWHPIMAELLDTHPGLDFLHDTKEFQARYVETVIARIFYTLDRKNVGRLSLRDIERSYLVESLRLVDTDDDINKELHFFSYEHFYVIYCKFWELDTDHDLEISRDELLRYGNHALTRRVVDRIFGFDATSNKLTKAPPRELKCQTAGRMGYHDFVFFCLDEEDKTTDTSIEFWTRCYDLDNDGAITQFDIEHFYKEQLYRMHCLNVEAVSLTDLLCQLNDMVRPLKDRYFTLADFKKPHCRPMISHFFNALGNLSKFVAHETRDPHSIRQLRMLGDMTDWDRFAAQEYVRMANEEDDEYEEEEEEIMGSTSTMLGSGGSNEAPF